MEHSKYIAKTLEEALAQASRDKGVDVGELTYNVIEEKSGFMGFGKTVEIEAYCALDISSFIARYIETYFANAEIEGAVSVQYEAPDFYRIFIDSDVNALLIGRDGRTLDLFNRLVRMAASSAFKKRVRTLIDINGYKKERYDRIVRMAIRVAKDVRRTHIDATLPVMPADERKAVHQALADMNYVSTKSEGEGSQRRLHVLYTPSKTRD